MRTASVSQYRIRRPPFLPASMMTRVTKPAYRRQRNHHPSQRATRGVSRVRW